MKKYFINIIFVFGIVIIINLLSSDLLFRLDLTEDHQYTLSEASKEILSGLEQPIMVKAYFSKDLPPNIAKVRRDFKDLLVEYASRSRGKFMYEISDPNENEKTEKKVLQEGIQPVLINIREKDQVKQQKAFLGAIVKMGDKKELIPFIQPGTALEYALSSAIKKISVSKKPVIGLLQGHGEAALDEMVQARAELEVLYDLKEIPWTDSSHFDTNINTLAIIRPMDTITSGQLKALDRFVNKGGNIFIALSRVKADLQTRRGEEKSTNLENWLSQKGIEIKPSLVIDAHCGAVSVQQQQGNFRYMSQVKFPYIPIASKFADHPAVKGLESVLLPFVSPIEYTGDSSINYTPLIFSSKKSALQDAPVFFQVEKHWTNTDFKQGNIPLAAAFQGKLGKDTENKMIVIGNGDFALNDKTGRKQVQKDNLSLLVNSIDWLSDDTGLIELRTKGISSRPLDDLEDSTHLLLKYINFLLPILIILLIGFFRMQRNKNIRIKRMEESYE